MMSENLEEARREIEILLHLDHPFIVKLEDCFKDNDDSVYIALEYMQHGSLKQIIENQKRFDQILPTDEILSMFTIICLGVYHMHCDTEEPLIHRDLKPENILIEKVGTMKILKITDFGISKRNNSRESVTIKGSMTYNYASIEQLE